MEAVEQNRRLKHVIYQEWHLEGVGPIIPHGHSLLYIISFTNPPAPSSATVKLLNAVYFMALFPKNRCFLWCVLGSWHLSIIRTIAEIRHAFAFRWVWFTVIVSRYFLIADITVIFPETVNIEGCGLFCGCFVNAWLVVLNSVVGLSAHGNKPLLSHRVQQDKHGQLFSFCARLCSFNTTTIMPRVVGCHVIETVFYLGFDWRMNCVK